MTLLKDIGEKEIIRSIIKPYFNPSRNIGGVGDDCAVIAIGNKHICLSTDRVPADLISFKLGLIDYYDLGNYLAVLNISDIAAMGAKPIGLLLTFAFEDTFTIENLKQLLNGVNGACQKYNCTVLGGDLSNTSEMSISATSVGEVESDKILFRSTSSEGDHIFCSGQIGLTPTAFKYFLELKPKGYLLSKAEEEILINQFKNPVAWVDIGNFLSESGLCTSCMDNTDGVGQTFEELSELNDLKFVINYNKIPVHELSYKVANALDIDVFDLILSAGADFQLLGTISGGVSQLDIEKYFDQKIKLVGNTAKGEGFWVKDLKDEIIKCTVGGWNYYSTTK